MRFPLTSLGFECGEGGPLFGWKENWRERNWGNENGRKIKNFYCLDDKREKKNEDKMIKWPEQFYFSLEKKGEEKKKLTIFKANSNLNNIFN